MGDTAREHGMILVDDRDRSVVQFLRIAPRLHDHRQGERVDHQAQKHEIAHEAAQLPCAWIGAAIAVLLASSFISASVFECDNNFRPLSRIAAQVVTRTRLNTSHYLMIS